MKKLILLVPILLTTITLSAQSPLPKGAKQFNAGVGLSGHGIPVYLGMDFGVHPDISLGGEVSFRRYRHDHHAHHHNHSVTSISGNANYHFNRLLQIPSNWDLYAGLNVGAYLWSHDHDDHDDHHSSGLGLGAQIGGRYYFSNRFGINLEFGGGTAFSGGKLGISLKF